MSRHINYSQPTQARLALYSRNIYQPSQSPSAIRRGSLLLITFVLFAIVVAVVISKAMMA